MTTCSRCKSYAINPSQHGRDGARLDLCDVCFWRDTAETRATRIERLEGVLLSRHGGECLSLIDELDACRLYVASVEEFVEVKLGLYLDRKHWDELKAGRPTDE